jgi:hypothetical protein
MGLSWQAAIFGLKNGQRVIFTRDYRHPGASDTEPTIPTGATGVVHDNELGLSDRSARLLSIEPDDKGLRAELDYEHDGLVFLFPPEGSDDEPYDRWDDLARRVETYSVHLGCSVHPEWLFRAVD